MTALVSPVRFDRLQAALVSVLGEATGEQVTWAYGQGVYEGSFDGDLIDLRIAVGPKARDYGWRRRDMLPPTVVDVAIDAAVADERCVIEVNDHAFYYDVDALDDEAAIRDGLIAALADETDYFTAAANGALVRLTPATNAGIWHVALSGSLSLDAAPLSTQAIRVTEGTHTLTIECTCFSKQTSPRAGAWMLAGKARGALEASDLVERLEAAELNVKFVGAGTDLSDVAGASWQSRVSFDLTIDVPAIFARDIDRVTQINYEGVPTFTVSA